MTDMDTGKYLLTEQGLKYLEQFKVDGAVITAAGFGSRFVPLTFETPKGLLEVFGERMIERQIKQLHEAGITDITIIVGYLKEKFEYLIDKYQVKLLYNPEYATKNNLATIYHARELFRGRNMYLLVSDNWIRNNMYHKYECGAWYSSVYMEGETSEWCLSSNKKGRITSVQVGGHDSGSCMDLRSSRVIFPTSSFRSLRKPIISLAQNNGTGNRLSSIISKNWIFFDELPAGGSGL